MYVIAVALLVLFLPLAWGSEFAKYPAEERLTTPPAKVRLVTPRARRFRTVLRLAAAEGPNFNGHFRVVKWGCGTNCIEWAVINLKTGVVWFAQEPAGSCWPSDEPEDFKVPEWLESRVDSRLFYLHQCSHTRVGRTFDRRYVYLWSDDAPKVIRIDHLE